MSTEEQEVLQEVEIAEGEEVVEEVVLPPQFPLEPEEAASYDLISQLSKHLDPHLIFPLLEFITTREIYKENQLVEGKLSLLSNTNMVDFAVESYLAYHNTEEEPEELIKKRADVLSLLGELQTKCQSIINLLRDSEAMELLIAEKNFNFEYLNQNHEVTREAVDAMYQYAKFQYECGNYSAAEVYLYHYEFLSDNPERDSSALWGKYASSILNQNWDSAIEDYGRLRKAIDSRTISPATQLHQRTWFINWSLYLLFNHADGRNRILDDFMHETYLNTIQLTCPYVLRYLAATVVINKKKRSYLKDIVKIISQEKQTYSDPITKFLEALYVDVDLKTAQEMLQKCDAVMYNDFFLVNYRKEFLENARLFMFEIYCRVHSTINISMLAEKLGMDEESAEKWIVNLIRNAKLDAKIDSRFNTVVMGTQSPNIYQQVIEKTKGLTFRSFALMGNVERKSSGTRQSAPTVDGAVPASSSVVH